MSTVCELEAMAIKIVSFPMKKGRSFHSYLKLPEGTLPQIPIKPPFSSGFPLVFLWFHHYSLFYDILRLWRFIAQLDKDKDEGDDNDDDDDDEDDGDDDDEDEDDGDDDDDEDENDEDDDDDDNNNGNGKQMNKQKTQT